MVFALPALSCYGLAPMASRSASAARWLASAAPLERELALLPFALTDALHPGETREVYVFEDRFVDGLREAVGTHGCVGAALFDEDGSLCDISLVLEVEDFRPSSTGGWARLRSVGRCRLTEVRAAAGGLARAHVKLYTDRGAAPAPDAELRKLHAAVSAQRRRLWELLSVEGEPNQAMEAEAEQLYVGPDVRSAPFGLFYGGTSPHPATPSGLVRTSVPVVGHRQLSAAQLDHPHLRPWLRRGGRGVRDARRRRGRGGGGVRVRGRSVGAGSRGLWPLLLPLPRPGRAR